MVYYSKVNSVDACIQLGILQYKHGKVNEAIQTYRRGLRFATRSADLHHILGVVFLKEGRSNEAIKELRIVLELEPNSVRSTAVRRQLKAIVGIDVPD